MSQINDALKRAQDIQPKNPPSSMLPMLPVESKSQAAGAGWVWPAAIILLLLLFAGVYFAVSPGSHEAQKIVASPAPVPAPAVETPPVPAPRLATAQAGAATQTAPAPQPARIQGIVYDPVRPYAIISGKTVFVGDPVDGQRVTAISRDAITLAGAGGQTTQLHVGGH